jgi:hypothetical protein
MNISISVIVRNENEKPVTSHAILDQKTVESIVGLRNYYKHNKVFTSFAEILADVIKQSLSVPEEEEKKEVENT